MSTESPRIYTRCPSCRNDTLTINDDKHLLCTWIDCKDPTLVDRSVAHNDLLSLHIKELDEVIAKQSVEIYELLDALSSLKYDAHGIPIEYPDAETVADLIRGISKLKPTPSCGLVKSEINHNP